ncbi:MAG TPA: glycosyltransferase, partial [Flavobacteriales bacterium]|nr:glycosyltransferase [Flavobacteriales bacterium]
MHNKVPRVAVLMAAYNGEQWIHSQLDSIWSQEGVTVDVFVSLDVSSDSTLSLLQRLKCNHTNLFILPYGERFGGAAKNFFRLIRDVDFSRFDYIALSDQDDIWGSGKLHYAIRTIEQDDLDGYSSDVIAFWSNEREKLVKKSFPQKKFDYFFEAAGPGCTYVLKQQSTQKFKNFLIKNWEYVNLVELHDWMIYAYFRSQGMKWKISTKPLVRYRQHEHNQFGSNSGLKAYLIRFNKIKTKWYRNEVQKIIYLLNGNSEQDISLKRLFLIKNFWYLRRRPRDAIFLLF